MARVFRESYEFTGVAGCLKGVPPSPGVAPQSRR
jgi:hypothetical protein